MAVRSGQRATSIRTLALSLATGIAAACTRQPVVTGPAAAGAFLYRGVTVHPFCVDLPQETLSRKEPMDLADCTDQTVPPRTVRDVWRSADRKPVDGRGAGGVEYRVLASDGDRFLLAVEASGGGTGSFSELFWVRLTDHSISIDRDELGGDRCADGIAGYVVTGDTLRFYATASTRRLIGFTGVSFPDSVRRRLRNA